MTKTTIITVLILRYDTYFMLGFQILYRWRNKQKLSMLALVQHMAAWHRDRFMDPEVWEKYLRHKLAPELMPAPSELELPLPIEHHLEQLQMGEIVSKINNFSFVCTIISSSRFRISQIGVAT